MITQLGQVMLYVEDIGKVTEFWVEKAGFVVLNERNELNVHSVEIAPSFTAQTRLVLFDRSVIEEQEPELNFGTPSLMFFTDDANTLHQEFKDAGITVGEQIEIGLGKVFNFADVEENYFAVLERK